MSSNFNVFGWQISIKITEQDISDIVVVNSLTTIINHCTKTYSTASDQQYIFSMLHFQITLVSEIGLQLVMNLSVIFFD